MIKKQVLLRSQIRTIYSSQKQQRMKVYFDLTEEYNQCIQPCKLQPSQYQQQCTNKCELIYDKYTDLLKDRYEGVNRQRLDMEVKNSQIFTTKKRTDRQGWFFNLFGYSFLEVIGSSQTPKIQPETRI